MHKINMQNDMRANRFTAADGVNLEIMIMGRMRDNETTFYETRERLAKIEGYLGRVK